MNPDTIIEAIEPELRRASVFEHDGYLVIRLKKAIKPLLVGFRTPQGKLVEQRNRAIMRYRRLLHSQKFFKRIALTKNRECAKLRVELAKMKAKP